MIDIDGTMKNDKAAAAQTVTIHGLKTGLYLHQIYGAFVIAQMEAFLDGGYQIDDIGLGKVISA